MSSSTDDLESKDSYPGSRTWLEDDKLSEAEHQQQWQIIKKGSDDLLTEIWNGYGKWAYMGFAGTCVGLGVILGYRKGQDKEMKGRPIPPQVRGMAFKALAAGTALCLSVSALTVFGISQAFGIKSIDEFQVRMRAAVPKFMSPVAETFEKVGLKRTEPEQNQVTDLEVQSLDDTLNEVFGESKIFEEFDRVFTEESADNKPSKN